MNRSADLDPNLASHEEYYYHLMSFAETSRLRYRAYRTSDLGKVTILWNDPRISRTSPTYVIPIAESKLEKDIPEIIEKAFMAIVVEAKEPNQGGDDWVGLVMLTNVGTPKNREVMFGIMLDVSFWDQGYGTEATRWVVNHAFRQLGVHRISLGTLEDNARAIKVYKRIGFIEEGRNRKQNFQDGRWLDMVKMSIIEDEWLYDEVK